MKKVRRKKSKKQKKRQRPAEMHLYSSNVNVQIFDVFILINNLEFKTMNIMLCTFSTLFFTNDVILGTKNT